MLPKPKYMQHAYGLPLLANIVNIFIAGYCCVNRHNYPQMPFVYHSSAEYEMGRNQL